MSERKIRRIEYSKKFLRSLRKLPNRIINEAERKEKIFRENPFNPQLKTHKLKGEGKQSWAFWIDYHYRIKFLFLSSGEALFLDIGTHNIYK